jgi:hypothetical protein
VGRAHGKQAGDAKVVELAGWPYPRHLAGRLFPVVVHGDVEGAKNVRRLLVDWLAFMRLAPASARAQLDRHIGYWQPCATSHLTQDEYRDIQELACTDPRDAKLANVGAFDSGEVRVWSEAAYKCNSVPGTG